LSAAQRERRRRILDATVALAAKGGYDAVQMRTVAERAEVALGTLYRYFPSKVHLLVAALTQEPDPGAAAEVSTVARQLERMFTKAMHDGEPSAEEIAIARVIGDIWLSNLVAWVTRRASADDVAGRLDLAARLLLGYGGGSVTGPEGPPMPGSATSRNLGR
jgi:AcrR family transcriptional regulator